MRLLGPDDDEANGMLFHPVEAQIDSELEQGLGQIKANMLGLIARRGRVKLVDHTLAVFGETYGVVPEKLVRRAARELSKAGQIQLNAQPKQPRDWEVWT